jgi:ATP-dependent Lon protease
MPLATELDEILVAAVNAGAKRILLPADSQDKYRALKSKLKNDINAIFYSTPLDAAKKALGVD